MHLQWLFHRVKNPAHWPAASEPATLRPRGPSPGKHQLRTDAVDAPARARPKSVSSNPAGSMLLWRDRKSRNAGSECWEAKGNPR
jgi:hypothetical protein